MIIITYICIIVYCMVENVNVIKDRLKVWHHARGDILRVIVRRMFINILILQQNKRQLNSLPLVILIYSVFFRVTPTIDIEPLKNSPQDCFLNAHLLARFSSKFR